MNKTTLALVMLISTLGWSQITYNSSDFADVNDSYIVSHAIDLTAFDFTATGANMTWDYSTLSPNTQDVILWENPNNTGYKTSWCFSNNYIFNCNSQFTANFNLATLQLDGMQIQGYGLDNVYMHSKLSTANFANKMIGANVSMTGLTLPLTISYTQPDILYQFPMNYNDSYTNPTAIAFNGNSMGIPLTYNSVGQRANVVEGWGSLITPFGTFANVLKLKSTLTETITVVANGQTTTNTQTTISYKWFDPAYGIPVLEVTGQEVAGLWTPANTSYFDIRRCLPPNAMFTYYPVTSDYDPATQTASVSFINLSTNFDVSDWDFGDGTPHSTIKSPTHSFSCPGVQQVTLTVTNQFCEPDETSTVTFPLTITDSQNAFTTGVTVSDIALTADRTLAGTTYEWLDCDNANEPIPNQTAQTFTPTVSGNYAVALTTNGCTSVSDCYAFTTLGVVNFNDNPSMRLYPNPTKDKVTLLNPGIEVRKVYVYNALGMLVGNALDLSANASGVYLLKLETDRGLFTQKVVKE
ncbi:T9SS type A sorting domain-containing protein [Flavobacterium sp. XGLA_31]|uniref:T9SS type A sorting domain-containing protein n=1 Tax=Flavobacterium sp. XGLA_31 TaxID=3447666 RepID=UPI003F38C3E6